MACLEIYNSLPLGIEIKATFFYRDFFANGKIIENEIKYVKIDPYDNKIINTTIISTYADVINIYLIINMCSYKYKFCDKRINLRSFNRIKIETTYGTTDPIIFFNEEIPIRVDKINTYSYRWYFYHGNTDDALDDVSQEERDMEICKRDMQICKNDMQNCNCVIF